MKPSIIIPSLVVATALIIGCGGSSSEKQTEAPAEATTEKKAEPLGNATKGKALFATCVTCHGQNGEGMKAMGAPALAGQEAYYLKKQLQDFRTNKRGTHADDAFGAQMLPFAKTLDSDGINDVVAYILTLPPHTATEATVEGDVENGKNYYNMVCSACHGDGAVGIEDLHSPRLAGMQDWYMERQIHNFKNGIRGTQPGDTYGAQMHQIAVAIPDEKTVDDVVAYINSLTLDQ